YNSSGSYTGNSQDVMVSATHPLGNGTLADGVVIDVADRIDDPDLPGGDTLTVTVDAVGSNGSTATVNGTEITIQPNAAYYAPLAEGETEEETFTYTVTDAAGLQSTATLTFTAHGENEAPVIDVESSDLSAQAIAVHKASGSFDAYDFLSAFDTTSGKAEVTTVNGETALEVQVNGDNQRAPHTLLEIVEAGVLESSDKVVITLNGEVTRTSGDQDVFFGLTDGAGQISYFSVNGRAGRLYAGELRTDAQPGDPLQNGAVYNNLLDLSGSENNSFTLKMVLDGETDTITVFNSSGTEIGTFDGSGVIDQTDPLDPALGLSLFLASDGSGETNYFVGLDYEMTVTRRGKEAGQISFSDPDSGDSHTATVTGVTVTGDAGLLGGADAFTFLNLDAVDQTADTLDWDWEMDDATVDNVTAGLGDGETLTLNYAVDITDASGETDTTSLTFTFNNDDLFV
ncbi:VCBS domain-containing protein, partial [uncultured Hoeflea sp.]|uniref:Ig-like domain-containing protein n=1 Tax=uncultured Hoeflea sp. TaxID=538666 RepID=UPI0030DA9B80